VTRWTAAGEGKASKGLRQWERLRKAEHHVRGLPKSSAGARKPGEPHDWLQGATNLQTVESTRSSDRGSAE